MSVFSEVYLIFLFAEVSADSLTSGSGLCSNADGCVCLHIPNELCTLLFVCYSARLCPVILCLVLCLCPQWAALGLASLVCLLSHADGLCQRYTQTAMLLIQQTHTHTLLGYATWQIYRPSLTFIYFYCHIITAHVPWWVKFLRACSIQCRNN